MRTTAFIPLRACVIWWIKVTKSRVDMKQVSWIVMTFLLLVTTSVFADDSDLLIRRANRFFSPMPDAMPGSESDTSERIALAKLQLDEELTDQQVSDITSFLKSLTDKNREQYVK